MTVALSGSTCLNAVSDALEAVRSGNPSEAANILHSIQNDARFLERELREYIKKLQTSERKHVEKADKLTKEINLLYQQEQKLQKEERELKGLKEELCSQNKKYEESRNEAERRHKEAKREEQKAREKFDEVRNLWWVPIYGQILLAKEFFENNAGKAAEACKDMNRHQRHINEANEDIRTTNSRINSIQEKIQQAQRRAQELRAQRDSCHNELGEVKSITAFLLDASKISREIINLTDEASLKTESLENIMRLAAKNTFKILRSGGTKTKVGSFKECWGEIGEMMKSNHLIYLDDEYIQEWANHPLKCIRDSVCYYSPCLLHTFIYMFLCILLFVCILIKLCQWGYKFLKKNF